jgi:hypothetical protein
LIKISFFFQASDFNEILAGVVLYLNFPVAHCQYIAANDKGRKTGALNYLIIYLIEKFLKDYHYFDFGIVNSQDGKEINHGMLAWKQRMGGRTISHDFYHIKTENYTAFEKIKLIGKKSS